MSRISVARPAAVCGLFALVLLAAACGGSASTTAASTTTPPTTTAGGNAANRLAAFRACMQSHGVTLPANARLGGGGRFGGGTGSTTDTTGPAPTTTLPPGVTEQQWQAAVTACASTLPTRQNNPQVQIYINCLNSYLSSHGGTTIPTGAGAGALFGGRGASGDTTTTNPTLQAALAHCAALRPAFGGRGPTTTSIG